VTTILSKLGGDPTSGFINSSLLEIEAALDALEAAIPAPVVDADATHKGIVQLAGDLAGTAASPQIASGVIVNSDVNAAAAIARSKLDFGSGLVNGDVAAAAAIARSKLDFGSGLVNSDIAASAAIAYSKLALSNSIVNGDIVDTTIKGRKFAWNIGTSPPGSPADGDLWLYAGTGFHWMFVYDSSEATYKWKYVGGGEVESYRSNDETFTANSAWQDASTVGPTFTIPRAGDYIVTGQASLYSSTIAAVKTFYVGAAVGAVTPSIKLTAGVANSGAGADCHPFFKGLANFAASDIVRLRYWSVTDASASHARERKLGIIPVRVI